MKIAVTRSSAGDAKPGDFGSSSFSSRLEFECGGSWVARRCPNREGEGAGSDGKLTAKQRAKLPAEDFGLPEKARSTEAKKESGNYPMPDKGHAISAKQLSRKQRKEGNLTKEEFDRINRKADKVLKRKRSK